MAALLAPAGNMEALKAAIAVSYKMNQQQIKDLIDAYRARFGGSPALGIRRARIFPHRDSVAYFR